MSGDSDKNGTELRLVPLVMMGIGVLNLWRGTHSRLVAEHRNHVATILALRNDVTAMRCTSYAGLRASQDRLHLLKAAYRASPDFDHAAE